MISYDFGLRSYVFGLRAGMPRLPRIDDFTKENLYKSMISYDLGMPEAIQNYWEVNPTVWGPLQKTDGTICNPKGNASKSCAKCMTTTEVNPKWCPHPPCKQMETL